jgi:hypothetical protein
MRLTKAWHGILYGIGMWEQVPEESSEAKRGVQGKRS